MKKKIQVNGEVLEIDVASEDTFSDLSRSIRDVKKNENLVLVSVFCDGDEIYQGSPEECLQKKVSDFKEVIIKVETLDTIAGRLLGNGTEFLLQLKKQVEDIALSFRVKSADEANKEFLAYVEGLHTVFELLETLRNSPNIKVWECKVNEQTGAEVIDEFNKANKELVQAQESKDQVLLADLLEYEIAPSLQKVSELMTNIRLGLSDNAAV